MEHQDHSESPHATHLETAIRKEVKEYGGIVEFLQTSIRERTAAIEDGVDETFRGNLRQMERIAKAIALPRGTVFETSNHGYASGFYWGEVIGMEIGERVFGDDWSAVLYGDLSKFYSRSRELAMIEEVDPSVNAELGITSPSRDSFRALLTANIMAGQLEDTSISIPLPDGLESLGREFAAELARDEETRRYIEMGYTLVMRIFSEVAVEITEDDDGDHADDTPSTRELTDEERTIAGTIDEMLHWNEILDEKD